jgi:sporulation protein YunB
VSLVRRFRRFPLAVSAWLRWCVLAMAVAFLLVRLADYILLGPLDALAQVEARMRAVDAINRVLVATVAEDLGRDELIHYEKDQQGRIAAYHVNTQAVNQVAARAATAVQAEFRKLSESSFGIPLGALSGSRILGSVVVSIMQEFQGEGINQTRHRVYLHATARVQVVLPVMSREVEVSADVPLTETVIVGPVPNGFYGGNVGSVSVPAGP